jgi:hypothetical protein
VAHEDFAVACQVVRHEQDARPDVSRVPCFAEPHSPPAHKEVRERHSLVPGYPSCNHARETTHEIYDNDFGRHAHAHEFDGAGAGRRGRWRRGRHCRHIVNWQRERFVDWYAAGGKPSWRDDGPGEAGRDGCSGCRDQSLRQLADEYLAERIDPRPDRNGIEHPSLVKSASDLMEAPPCAGLFHGGSPRRHTLTFGLSRQIFLL